MPYFQHSVGHIVADVSILRCSWHSKPFAEETNESLASETSWECAGTILGYVPNGVPRGWEYEPAEFSGIIELN